MVLLKEVRGSARWDVLTVGREVIGPFDVLVVFPVGVSCHYSSRVYIYISFSGDSHPS